MFDKELIEEIIKDQIEANENIGESSGGSGHLSNTNYQINSISEPTKLPKGFRIIYSYSIFVETEFTYYPDNPPKESIYECSITINTDGKIIQKGKSKCLNSSIEDEWMLDNINFDYYEDEY